MVRVRDRIRVMFRVNVSIRAVKYGWSAAHFDDLQMHSVDERVD